MQSTTTPATHHTPGSHAAHTTPGSHPAGGVAGAAATADLKAEQHKEAKAEKQAGIKPTMGDKISGTVEQTVGKVTKNPVKVEEGLVKKTEGKAAAQHVGVAGNGLV
ncbi:hypothetical protein RQP46_009528 [Phenoliferia psychrophenolica]